MSHKHSSFLASWKLPVTILFGIALSVLIALWTLPTVAQSNGVTAEAIIEANLRAFPGTDAEQVGRIEAGTRYPVLGISEFFPWLLLGDPATTQPMGWVFRDLVTVNGDLNSVPFSDLEVVPGAAPTLPAATADLIAEASGTPGAPTQAFTPTPTLNASVIGTVLGEINIRYGPGTEYPRLGVGKAGDQFEVVRWHTQQPWVEIRYTESPTGTGWVAIDLLEYQGNVESLPATSQLTFSLPTLTPTISPVEVAKTLDGEPVPLSGEFRALGERLWTTMLAAQFDPNTSRMGALYLRNLQTGEAITFGSDIAFSGMSMSKIAILTALFGQLDAPPDDALAVTIAESMICSENTSTNDLLRELGNGEPFAGAVETTDFLRTLGLSNTFITAPYAPDPSITAVPATAPQTTIDQASAGPDPFNQLSVDEMGLLLDAIYECAYSGTGPLMDRFPGQYEQRECQVILHVMSSNRISAMLESGVPENTRIAHKHGWVEDTHGDAGIVYTPGGDFAIVVALHNPEWIAAADTFPLVAELTRETYNFFNPANPFPESTYGIGVEECELLGNPVIEDMMSVMFTDPRSTPVAP